MTAFFIKCVLHLLCVTCCTRVEFCRERSRFGYGYARVGLPNEVWVGLDFCRRKMVAPQRYGSTRQAVELREYTSLIVCQTKHLLYKDNMKCPVGPLVNGRCEGEEEEIRREVRAWWSTILQKYIVLFCVVFAFVLRKRGGKFLLAVRSCSSVSLIVVRIEIRTVGGVFCFSPFVVSGLFFLCVLSLFCNFRIMWFLSLFFF